MTLPLLNLVHLHPLLLVHFWFVVGVKYLTFCVLRLHLSLFSSLGCGWHYGGVKLFLTFCTPIFHYLHLCWFVDDVVGALNASRKDWVATVLLSPPLATISTPTLLILLIQILLILLILVVLLILLIQTLLILKLKQQSQTQVCSYHLLQQPPLRSLS